MEKNGFWRWVSESSCMSNTLPCRPTMPRSCRFQQQYLWWPVMLAKTGNPQPMGQGNCSDRSNMGENSVLGCSSSSTVHKDKESEWGIITKLSKHHISLLFWCSTTRFKHIKCFFHKCCWPPKLTFIFSKAQKLCCLYFDRSWNNYLYKYMERGKNRRYSPPAPELTFQNQTKTSSFSCKHFSNDDWTDPVYWYISCLMPLWGLVDKMPWVHEADV